MRFGSGFTLIELIVVVAMVGIFLSLGVFVMPWSHFAVNQAAEGLARDVQLARLEAIRINEFVGISIDPGTDTYTLFIDLDRNGDFDDSEQIIKSGRVGNEGVDITGVSNSPIVYDTRGMPLALASSGIQLNNRGGTYPRRICVSQQGRTRVVTGTACS